jgi:hypothetical protein
VSFHEPRDALNARARARDVSKNPPSNARAHRSRELSRPVLANSRCSSCLGLSLSLSLSLSESFLVSVAQTVIIAGVISHRSFRVTVEGKEMGQTVIDDFVSSLFHESVFPVVDGSVTRRA